MRRFDKGDKTLPAEADALATGIDAAPAHLHYRFKSGTRTGEMANWKRDY
jgi:hypothetical protein